MEVNIKEVLITLPVTPRQKRRDKLGEKKCGTQEEPMPEYVSPFLVKLIAQNAPLELDIFKQLLKNSASPRGPRKTAECGSVESIISTIKHYNNTNGTRKDSVSKLSCMDGLHLRPKPQREKVYSDIERQDGYGEEEQPSLRANKVKGKNASDVISSSPRTPRKGMVSERRKPLWFPKINDRHMEEESPRSSFRGKHCHSFTGPAVSRCGEGASVVACPSAEVKELQRFQHSSYDVISKEPTLERVDSTNAVQQGMGGTKSLCDVNKKIANAIQKCKIIASCGNHHKTALAKVATDIIVKQRKQKRLANRPATSPSYRCSFSKEIWQRPEDCKDECVMRHPFPVLDVERAIGKSDVNHREKDQVHASRIASTRLAEVVDMCCQKGLELLRVREIMIKDEDSESRKFTNQSWKAYQKARQLNASRRATRREWRWSIYTNGNKFKAINASKVSEAQLYLDPSQVQHRIENRQMAREVKTASARDDQERPQQSSRNVGSRIGPWTPTPDASECSTAQGKRKTGS